MSSHTKRRSGAARPHQGGRNKTDRLEKDLRDFDRTFYSVWTPSTYTAFKALLSARLCSAIWSHITDCDETFNYWEPLAYILNGHGFQTWEYSPAYALRSYAFIWIYALPLKLYTALSQPSRIVQFYFLRIILALVCSLCEAFFYRSVQKQFGSNVSRLLLCFLVFGSGMHISATAFLPSTFSMYMGLLSIGAWYVRMYPLAIFCTAVSAIVGWPFAAALGIPIAWDLIKQKKIATFVLWSAISGVVCLVPVVAIDSQYYGKLVVAPLNIITYNVFSDHGPDIYGVEPWTFYFLNGFLNFNFVFVLAVMSLPVILFINIFKKSTTSVSEFPLWFSLLPMYIWIAVFFTRPHKEERFLFPVYPLFCSAAAVTLDHTQKFISWMLGGPEYTHYTVKTRWIAILFCVLTSTLSVSRSVALYKGYHAPLDVYAELNQLSEDTTQHALPADRVINVCVGREWYRSPGNFFMPNNKWQLQFLKSQFRGQLPKHYSAGPNATSIVPTHMNDVNLEEPTRYVDLSKCHYLVDLDLPDTAPYEPRYSQNTDDWKVVISSKFLNNMQSNKLFRAFYIPFISQRYCSYVDYVILQSTKYKNIHL